MKKGQFIWIAILIWILSVGSLLAIRFLTPKRSNAGAAFSAEARILYQNLDEAVRRSLDLFEGGMIKTSTGEILLIGERFEAQEEQALAAKELQARPVEFVIRDRLALERRLLAGEAFRSLNNAEKRCYLEGFACFIYREGIFFFFVNPKKYAEYVIKYGTACENCDDGGDDGPSSQR
jgi:hypothetical protein